MARFIEGPVCLSVSIRFIEKRRLVLELYIQRIITLRTSACLAAGSIQSGYESTPCLLELSATTSTHTCVACLVYYGMLCWSRVSAVVAFGLLCLAVCQER